MLTFPNINPVAFEIGPLKVHWYGIAYMVGIYLAWQVGMYLLKKHPTPVTPKILDDSIIWVILGIVIGGRLGHVVFYAPSLIWTDPIEIFKTWNGGMSFHGGLIGVLAALFIYARRVHIRFLNLLDISACITPIGLFCGRIANFINGELWGRVTDSSLGMIFPRAGDLPRYPSQLFEAATEGILLFFILIMCWTKTDLRNKPGRISGIFAIGYALARMFCELFREPDAIVVGSLTIGQALSIPLIGAGWFLLRYPTELFNNKES